MPRSRLSYDQAALKGSAKANPARFSDRKQSPATQGTVGDPPAYFAADIKPVWTEIAAAIPAGVAGSSDRIAVEMAARLLYQFRTDPEMQASRISILAQTLSRLGLDPQARTRLHTEAPAKDDDEWSFPQ